MNANAKLAALFARTSTPALVTALLTLDKTADTPELRWSRAKTIGELERRFPDASAAVERAFDEAEGQEPYAEVDYVAVLIAAIPADQR